MGYPFVDVELGDIRRNRTKRVRMLADTGAGFMALPKSLSRELHIEPVTKIDATLADGRREKVDLGFAYVKVLDRETVAQALILDTPEPLLGSFTLQLLGLMVDPTREEVKPSRSFGLGLLGSLH